MDLGVRQIRTAGKGSGSIELTLPVELRDLVGLPCKVTLRDGSRPDIVLRPDLRRALDAFESLWRPMARSLLPHAPGVFPAARFTFGLQPRAGGEGPYLCWRDGLQLALGAAQDSEALARVFAAFAHAMACDIGIEPGFAGGFGVVCGLRLTGSVADYAEQEACDLAVRHLPPLLPPLAAAGGVVGAGFWTLADAVLEAAANLFVEVSSDPVNLARLRAAWRRGRAIELSGE